MKVLLLVDDLLPGGVARHIVDIANNSISTDIKIFVAATPGKYIIKLNPKIHFTPLALRRFDSFEKKFLGIIPSVYKLSRLIQREKIDIIHSHKRYSHLIGKLLSKHYNIPHITSYHIVPEGKKIFTVFGDFSICCADAVKKQAINKFGCIPERVKTIYYGIKSFETYSDTKKKSTLDILGISSQKRIISSVGQFIPIKDRETLILAVEMLKNERNISDLVFVLLGYGPQKDYLISLTKKLGLENSIKIIDGMSSVEALFNISEFMILSSQLEGFPIVHLEAASLGKMHISTNVGGSSEFIENYETGLLVEPKDPVQLAKSIAYLIDNPDESIRMGKNAKLKYEADFTLDVMMTKLIEVYRFIYSNRNATLRTE